MSDLTSEIALWISKFLTAPEPTFKLTKKYPDAQLPVDLRRDNDPTIASALLEAKARALVELHENRAFSGLEPFTQDDYAAFSAAHKDIAEGHRFLGEALKTNQPDAIQAISAHGDAMALHNEASKLAEMMLPAQELGERNKMWPHMESNSFRYGRNAPWDTEEKNWRKAHQAFLASQMANRQTAFGTGVVIKGDVPGHEFHGNQWTNGQFAAAHERISSDRGKLDSLVKGFEGGGLMPKDDAAASQVASRLRDYHKTVANAHRAVGNNDIAEKHDYASTLMNSASALLQQGGPATDPLQVESAVNAAQKASMDATDARPSQKSVSEITKGDVAGHAFHGNQWTSGGGLTTTPKVIGEIKGVHGGPFRVTAHVLPDDAKYGAGRPIIAFHDASQDPEKFGEHGQFVSSYYAKTLADGNLNTGIDLQGDVPSWKIPADELQKVMPAIQEIAATDQTPEPNYTLKSAEIIQKGDVVGHVFHGNQYVAGTTSIPSDVGHRDFDPKTTLDQIGKMNVLGVSGGKVNTIHDADGKSVGLELPVSSGYKVRVFLRDDDTYTVQRVHRDNVKGEQSGVYADEVGEAVYQAGMYKSNPFGGHSPR